jgi:hypothetical protein
VIAVAIAAWELKTAVVELAHDLGDGAQLQEGRQQKREPFLHLQVRVLDEVGVVRRLRSETINARKCDLSCN